jgi:hypothetical protein
MERTLASVLLSVEVGMDGWDGLPSLAAAAAVKRERKNTILKSFSTAQSETYFYFIVT